MKVIKFLFLTIFSFAVISCSNIYNQGEASLEICLPGSPDSDARFIGNHDPDEFADDLLPGSVYEIILDGPMHLEKLTGYGESCVFENLVCGRYKLSVYNWSGDPYAPQATVSLYCYGEKDIAVTGGENIKSIDIYSLTPRNVKEITGCTATLFYGYSQIIDSSRIAFDSSMTPVDPYNFQNISNGYGIVLNLDNDGTSAEYVYRGGYKEQTGNDLEQHFKVSSWIIYKNGQKVCDSNDFDGGINNPNYFTFYINDTDYEIVYILKDYDAAEYNEGSNTITVRAPLRFQYNA